MIARLPPACCDTRHFALVLAMSHLLVTAVGLWHHEMWRDELQAWMLARDSDSLAALLHNLRFEGHPAAWHLLLFAVVRLAPSPHAMQVLHLLLAATVVYVVGRWAPLPRWQRVLFAFGYFIAYEYAVLSRSYVLGVLALFAGCALLPLRARSHLPVALALALLANTSVHGLLLAGAFSLMLLVDALGTRAARARERARWHDGAAAAVLVVAAALLAVVQILPPAAAPFTGRPMVAEAAKTGLVDAWLRSSLTFWRAYVPIPVPTVDAPWGTNLVLHWEEGLITKGVLLLSAGVAALVLLVLARRTGALVFYAVATFGLVLFDFLVHAGHLRHQGHHFVVLIAALWMARAPAPGLPTAPVEPPPRPRTALARASHAAEVGLAPVFGVLLIAHIVGAAVIYAADLRRPFSDAATAAAVIEQHGPPALPVVGTERLSGSAVAAYLRRPIYFLDVGAWGTWADWGRRLRQDPPVEGEVLALLQPFLAEHGPAALVLSHAPVTVRPAGWSIEELARTSTAMQREERYHIYRIARLAEMAGRNGGTVLRQSRGTRAGRGSDAVPYK